MKVFSVSNFMLLLAVLLATSVVADALSVHVHPADFVYLSEEAPERNLYSAIVQNIAILNDDSQACSLESIQLKAFRDGSPIVTLHIPPEQIDLGAQRIAGLTQQGVLKAYDFYFQTSRYFPEDVKYSSSRNLEAGSAILISTQSMLLPATAEEIAISAKCSKSSEPVTATKVLKLKKRISPNEYHFPLSGTIYVGAASTLSSHHRWVANEEFALDLAFLQGSGQTHTGDGTIMVEVLGYENRQLQTGWLITTK